MEKVYVMDNRGRETEAFKVRYFNYGENDYFIYTLGEIDKDEYVKLYLKMLKNGEEQFISENEWLEIRGMIQKVVKEIKNGSISSFKDLNMSNLNEIMETDTRVFKLKKNIVEQIIYEEPRVEIKEEVVIEEKNEIPDTKTVIPEVKEEKITDSFIENIEDSIKNTFTDEITTVAKEEPKVESKMKPIIVGSVAKDEYKEKYAELQKQMDDYKVIIYKLKEENTVLKNKVLEYHEKLEKLKKLLEDI